MFSSLNYFSNIQFLDYTNANKALSVEGVIEGETVEISKSNNAEIRVGLINALKSQYGIPANNVVKQENNFNRRLFSKRDYMP